MYEFLKVLFGTTEDGNPEALTYDQLVEKLTAAKDIKLANLAAGGYVSKEKFDSKETELAGIKEQLTSANATIQSYKDMDIDGIKQSAADWEKKYTEETAALTQKLADQERTFNEETFLNGYKFSSKAARDGVRSEFVKRKFPYEDGSFIGGKEFMEKLMADDDYKAAFVIEAPKEDPKPEDTQPEKPKPQFSAPKQTQIQGKPKIGLAEMMRRKNENPDTQINFD